MRVVDGYSGVIHADKGMVVEGEAEGMVGCVDADELVRETMQRLDDVSIDIRPSDAEESRLVEEFSRGGCGCKKKNGKPCSSLFLSTVSGVIQAWL